MKPILFSLLLCAAMALAAQDYTLGSDSQPQDGVPKGTVTKFVLPPGKAYPGTPHNCAIYVPAQYDASRSTPFMIFLDGSQALGNGMRVPVVLDNLIAKQDLPPMIGIFVDPGILPVVSDADQNRYNRIYEYDSLTPRFAEFLINELIPAVAKNYNLSKNPDDRGLSGVSTGAVGAFMAAWNRPDQFHRVLSFIGTYVSMKGADAMPALVRKTEPKPIRIFMQDGTQDHIVASEPFGSSPFGSWPINNQVMYEALEFAGYDVKLEMGTEAHNTKQAGAIMPDALRWLWRGYPEPIVVHEPAAAHEPGYDIANRVFSTIYLDKPWTEIGGGFGSITSLTADRNGNAYLPDEKGQRILRVDPLGKTTTFAKVPGLSPILHAGPGDRLYAWIPAVTALDNPDRGALVSWSTAGGVAGDKKIHVKGDQFATPGAGQFIEMDFAVMRDGTIYALTEFDAKRIDPSGRVSVALAWGTLQRELGPRSRIALSPDQSMAVIVDQLSRSGWSFQIAADGSLQNGEPFYRLEVPQAPSGAAWVYEKGNPAEDTDGMVYFPTALGIQVAMQNGRIVEILNPPIPGGGPLTAMSFAGDGDQNWLYVAQDGKLFRRPVKVIGANSWTVVKPPKPTL
ncbi:MAG: alpha/beta hydrolase-fold protein [Terracidiphilus sp.]